MPPVVGVSVQTKHVISDEAVVGEWLVPAVRKVIEEAGEDYDTNVLATACTMKWCFMPALDGAANSLRRANGGAREAYSG